MKPGDPAGAFDAGVDLDAAVSDLVARDAVEIPPYPAIALRIEALVRGGDYGLVELAKLVASDQTLSADVLRCASTAAYARGAPVTSVASAVGRIGAGELSRIALASALGSHALARGPLAALRRNGWHDALTAAVLCREVARVRRVPPEEAFTCGLLHDFGKVLAVACLERLAAGARAPRRMAARFWEAIVERFHVPLGRTLARRWSLPRAVADAIALHHAEGWEGAERPELLEIVAATDPVVRVLADRSHLGAEDAAAIAALGDAEADAVTRALETLPAFVASFERDPGAVGPTLLARPAPPRWADASGAGLVLHVHGASGQHFEVVGFLPHQLVVRGDAPLAEGLLLEVDLPGASTGPFHARVSLCWSEPGDDRFSALLMPFALSGAALLRWQGLVAARG